VIRPRWSRPRNPRGSVLHEPRLPGPGGDLDVRASRFDIGQRAVQRVGSASGDETRCLGLNDDAGHVVGNDIVELSGQLQPLVASGGVDGDLAVGVQRAQPQSDTERAYPERRTEADPCRERDARGAERPSAQYRRRGSRQRSGPARRLRQLRPGWRLPSRRSLIASLRSRHRRRIGRMDGARLAQTRLSPDPGRPASLAARAGTRRPGSRHVKWRE
jgi:hypothetical protein